MNGANWSCIMTQPDNTSSWLASSGSFYPSGTRSTQELLYNSLPNVSLGHRSAAYHSSQWIRSHSPTQLLAKSSSGCSCHRPTTGSPGTLEVGVARLHSNTSVTGSLEDPQPVHDTATMLRALANRRRQGEDDCPPRPIEFRTDWLPHLDGAEIERGMRRWGQTGSEGSSDAFREIMYAIGSQASELCPSECKKGSCESGEFIDYP